MLWIIEEKIDLVFQDAVHVYSGGIDCFLKSFDLNSNTENILGSHDAPIRSVVKIILLKVETYWMDYQFITILFL